jgi:hypothetical protein
MPKRVKASINVSDGVICRNLCDRCFYKARILPVCPLCWVMRYEEEIRMRAVFGRCPVRSVLPHHILSDNAISFN